MRKGNGIGRVIGKMLLRTFAALLGMGLAVALYLCFDVIKIQGSDMLPTLEPGQYVVVSKLKPDQAKLGDLILYEAPYFDIGSGGKHVVRRIVGIKDDWVKVGCDADLVTQQTEILERTEILGKVLFNNG